MRAFLIEKPEAALLVDCGLGKSRSVIEAIRFLFSDLAIRGVLIVAPLRVCACTWPAELKRWAPELTFADIRSEAGMQAWKDRTADVYIVNFEQLASQTKRIRVPFKSMLSEEEQQAWRDQNPGKSPDDVDDKGKLLRAEVVRSYPGFMERGFRKNKRPAADMLVIDELSMLKNHSSKMVRAIQLYRDKFRRFAGLTGTPTPQSTLDLFSQIRVLDGGARLGPSFTAFRDRYAESDYMGFRWQLRPGAAESIREKIADICLVQRDADWADLPPVTIKDVEVVLPAEAMKKYRQMEKDCLIQLDSKDFVASSAAALVSKLLQMTSGVGYIEEEDGSRSEAWIHDAKLEALKKIHDQEGREPTLVFTALMQEPPRIIRTVQGAGDFDASRKDEWDRGEIPMWIAHPKRIAHGLNLQDSCRLIVWFSLTYNSEHYVQGNKRVARIGQTRPVTIYRLIVPDTVDEALVEALRVKGDNQDANMIALRNLKLMREKL